MSDNYIINTNEGLVFNPLIHQILKLINILNRYNIYSTPNNNKLYQRAFVHKSY